MNNAKRNLKSNAIYNGIKKNKILRSTLHQGGERLVHLKLQKKQLKEIKEDTNNGKILHVHGLEDLIYFKCPKQSTDSTQSLPKAQ